MDDAVGHGVVQQLASKSSGPLHGTLEGGVLFSAFVAVECTRGMLSIDSMKLLGWVSEDDAMGHGDMMVWCTESTGPLRSITSHW